MKYIDIGILSQETIFIKKICIRYLHTNMRHVMHLRCKMILTELRKLTFTIIKQDKQNKNKCRTIFLKCCMLILQCDVLINWMDKKSNLIIVPISMISKFDFHYTAPQLAVV